MHVQFRLAFNLQCFVKSNIQYTNRDMHGDAFRNGISSPANCHLTFEGQGARPDCHADASYLAAKTAPKARVYLELWPCFVPNFC